MTFSPLLCPMNQVLKIFNILIYKGDGFTFFCTFAKELYKLPMSWMDYYFFQVKAII